MKHKYLPACLVLSITLALSACGSDAREAADYIGIDSAKGIALKSAGLSPDQAEFTTAGLDKKDGIFYYQICFSSDGTEYEYAIDALTGVVIQGPLDPGIPVLADGGSNPSGSQQIQSPGSLPGSTQPPDNTHTGTIDEQQACDIAIIHSGISRQDITQIEVKQEDDDGIALYKVKFKTSGSNEYEYEIDRYSGRIISLEHDLDDYNQPSPPGATARIGQAQAMDSVLARVPGASNSDISIRLEEDDGRLEYKGRIRYDGMEYKFKLDAYSGALTEWEAEPDD
ncbi:PepSY domain-containing protein [Enterocloster aldenensis]|uniref:PepSY domain-containing protein n=1 Tax=Enterocloster aldenensis TaxID=358742 RepID=UPI004024EC37